MGEFSRTLYPALSEASGLQIDSVFHRVAAPELFFYPHQDPLVLQSPHKFLDSSLGVIRFPCDQADRRENIIAIMVGMVRQRSTYFSSRGRLSSQTRPHILALIANMSCLFVFNRKSVWEVLSVSGPLPVSDSAVEIPDCSMAEGPRLSGTMCGVVR